jgi:hypothetical protein
MSINPVILELSQQIAHLQSEYESLVAENKKIKQDSQVKVERTLRKKDQKPSNQHFLKSVEVLKEKRLSDLERKYKVDLEFIRSRYPRWKPNI